MVTAPTFYNLKDQGIYSAGDFFIPQERYRAAPFTANTSTNNPDEVPAGIPTTYQAQNMRADDNFGPFNPDMSQIRTDFDPTAYNLAMRNEAKFGPTVGPNPDMYYRPQSGLEQLAGKAVGLVPFIGPISRVAGFLSDKLPVNKRSILENELRGSGVLTDNIGRIVAQQGQYNTPEGIMAGYNAAMMNEGTFDKRTQNIRETLKGKYKLSDTQIDKLISGELDEDDFTGSQYQLPSGKISNLFSNIRNIEIAKQNFLNQQNKADEIAAYKAKQKQQKALEKQRTRTRESDAAAGAFSNQVQQDSGGGGGGGSWREQTAAKERQGVSVAGPGFGKGAYFMDGGLVDLVDIYD